MTQASRTPEAELDLRDIGYYIGVEQDRPEVAERLLRELAAKCDLYATNPDLGSARPDLGADLRIFPFKRWVVVYRPIDDGIEVLPIIDGSRDYSKLFE